MTHKNNSKLKSLGYLRKNRKTKERSPDLIGKITLQRHTVETLAKGLDDQQTTDVEGNVAAWIYQGEAGPFLRIELSPRYLPEVIPVSHEQLFDYLMDDETMETDD